MKQRSFRAERESGVVVGFVLILLGSWWVDRGKFEVATALAISLGLVLLSTWTSYPSILVFP
jgi:hypothetical protein